MFITINLIIILLYCAIRLTLHDKFIVFLYQISHFINNCNK